jgi:cell wall-associated NlpC family hydrolase
MPGLSHVGIYVGDGQFVDAGTERTGVRRASLSDPYWASRFAGARRLR